MDMTTDFLGFKLKNPLIAGASSLTANLDSIKRLEDNGIAAVIMHSLFEEQINREIHELDHFLYAHSDSHAEATDYFNTDTEFDNLEAEHYLSEVQKVKASVDVPVIASLNGVSKGGWVKFAKKLEEAGADAVELNISYIPTDMEISSATVEEMYIETVRTVRESIGVPLNVKMSAYFSSPSYMAKRFADAGANGLTIFDHPVCVDIDLEGLTLTQKANITSSKELSETLRWCGILYGKLPLSICAGTGVHTAEDILKAMMSGADSVALASALIVHKEGYVAELLESMRQWMSEREYESIAQMKGSISLAHTDNPALYERGSYMRALSRF